MTEPDWWREDVRLFRPLHLLRLTGGRGGSGRWKWQDEEMKQKIGNRKLRRKINQPNSDRRKIKKMTNDSMTSHSSDGLMREDEM